jgi:signal peptidase
MDKNTSGRKQQKRNPQKRNPLAGFFRLIGTILLVLIVLVCVPIAIPNYMGYQVYTVISGSMEPAIPVGSLVYVRSEEPETIEEGDVIAFYGAGAESAITTHRVVANHVVSGEFVTKGDANDSNDINPIPYANLIGKVIYTVPYLGTVAELLVEDTGKMIAAGVILFAVILHLIASLLDRLSEKKELEREAGKNT